MGRGHSLLLSLFASLLFLSSPSLSLFNPCRFNFGTFYEGEGRDYSGLDYLTIWVGTPDSATGSNNFNPWHHGKMLETAKRFSLSPVFYAYITAFLARSKAGLKDCDVGTPSLCQYGAKFIRENRQLILDTYRNYAQETAKFMMRGREAGEEERAGERDVIWLIEPDFYQYSARAGTQEGGGLSDQEMLSFFQSIVSAIKESLPNAKISWDISPWVNDQASWWGTFASLSSSVSFIHTSGGRTEADNPRIRLDPNNLVTWAGVSSLTGKRVIADDGYGVGGQGTGHDNSWDDVNNLRARINDGVIAITQANPRGDWRDIVARIRPQLPSNLCGRSEGDEEETKRRLLLPSFLRGRAEQVEV